MIFLQLKKTRKVLSVKALRVFKISI